MPVKFSDAFEICKNKFIEEGYDGVGAIYQTDEAWVFCPAHEGTEYGVLPIVFPRDGREPFYFNYTLDSLTKYVDNAVIIK